MSFADRLVIHAFGRDANDLSNLALAPLWCHTVGVEKRKPSFDLDAFKTICGDPRRLATTRVAIASANALGFGLEAVSAVIRSMRRTHFHKSMTSYTDHRRWQDVYHVPWEGMVLYVKFTDDIVTEFTVLSFKER